MLMMPKESRGNISIPLRTNRAFELTNCGRAFGRYVAFNEVCSALIGRNLRDEVRLQLFDCP